jgi:hypothetical protein
LTAEYTKFHSLGEHFLTRNDPKAVQMLASCPAVNDCRWSMGTILTDLGVYVRS